MAGAPAAALPTGYKLWVFGSKLVGVLIFAIGIELLTRGQLAWAGLLLLVGAVVVLAPVRSPDKWRGIPKRRA